jgi:hypothetical protein
MMAALTGLMMMGVMTIASHSEWPIVLHTEIMRTTETTSQGGATYKYYVVTLQHICDAKCVIYSIQIASPTSTVGLFLWQNDEKRLAPTTFKCDPLELQDFCLATTTKPAPTNWASPFDNGMHG